MKIFCRTFFNFLENIGLRHNNFVGTIPEQLCEVNFSNLVVDNNLVCYEECGCLSEYIRTTK